jgi:hypothetical protein
VPVKKPQPSLGWDVLPILGVAAVVIATTFAADGASLGGNAATIVTVLVATAIAIAN